MSHVDSYRKPAEREPEPPTPKNWAKIFFFAALFMTFTFAGWGITRAFIANSFEDNCQEYLSFAANGFTPEKSLEDLKTVIEYVEDNSLTEGYTTIAWANRPPSEDVGRWYQHLNDVQERLEDLVNEETPEDIGEPLAYSIMKKQRFVDIKSSLKGPPNGISISGYNTAFFWWAMLSVLSAAGLWIAYGVSKPYNKWW